MLSLLAVGAHLYIQIAAQREAEEAIYSWADKANIEIGSLRYHLLRNGLILKNVHLKREEDQLTIDHMLIRARPELLTSETPHINSIQASGFYIEINRYDQLNGWDGDSHLFRIMQATQRFEAANGHLSLQLANASEPVNLEHIQLSRQTTGSHSRLEFTSQLAGSPVQGYWLRTTATDSANGSGEIAWRNINLTKTAQTINVGATRGLLTGQLQWQGEGQSDTSLSGQMRLTESLDNQPRQSANLKWNGTIQDGKWHISIDSTNWPLNALSRHMPVLAGRTFKQGNIDGNLIWQSHLGNMQFNSNQGKLSNILYSTLKKDEPDWSIASLRYSSLKLNPDQKKLQAKKVSAENIHTYIRLTTETEPPGPSDWHLNIDHVELNHLNVGLQSSDGSLHLSKLTGTCISDDSGLSSIKLQSELNRENQNSPDWKIEGNTRRGEQLVESAALKIEAKQIPLTQLRPMIPLQSSTSSPLMLDGIASLTLSADYSRGAWQLQGKAEGKNILMSHAGNRWMAENIALRFGPVGSALRQQTVQSFTAEQWHYISALQPLPPYSENQADSPATGEPSWWANNLISGHWEIRDIHWKNGQISVGQPDSYWMQNATLEIDSLKRNSDSRLLLEGSVGGGHFALKGNWSPLSDTETFIGSGHIENATPLFLREWMQASSIALPVRGRISALMKVARGSQLNEYNSNIIIRLKRLQVEQQLVANDPIIDRTGFNMIDLLRRLKDEEGNIHLKIPIRGNWQTEPLNLQRIGHSLQQKVRDRSGRSDTTFASKPASRGNAETRIRLHDSGRLSLNERTRLRKVLQKMREDPNLVVDLIPKWAGESISWESEQRINHTQHLIERFLNHRGIAKSRIYPSAPTAQDRATEIASIWVVTSRND